MAATAAEVRARGQWESGEVSDVLLATKAFIPMGEAWLTKKLTDSGLTYAGLSAVDKALADAAEIAAIASVVAMRASKGEFKTGLLAIKDVDPDKMVKLAQELRYEAAQYLSLIGVTAEGSFHFTSGGGNDYAPDGEDLTQIDYTEADSDTPFSMWP